MAREHSAVDHFDVDPGVVTILIGGESFKATPEQPFVFGRSDDPARGIVGLDANDMGISALAGTIEWSMGVWWIVNESRKRRLLLDLGGGGAPKPLDCGRREVITVPKLTVLVTGAIYSHALDVLSPDAPIIRANDNGVTRETTGTILAVDSSLTDRERDALTAVLSGFLEPYPRRHEHPRSYAEAAQLLGGADGGWTEGAVRKAVERVKERYKTKQSLYFEGPTGTYELAAHLISNGTLGPDDLRRLRPR